MHILIAPDKFKGSLTADEVAAAIASGLHEVWPDATLVTTPVADGGEGTAQTLCAALKGEMLSVAATDALGRPITASYGWVANTASKPVAIIEMSSASGIWHLQQNVLDPLHASTFGTGELMRDAIRRGAKTIILGLGGSATNDGGIGMAAALGVRFLDHSGQEVTPLPCNLAQIVAIDRHAVGNLPEIIAACDVINPLLGPTGATAIYGPQKGVTATIAPQLEAGLSQLAEVAAQQNRQPLHTLAGAGAAGGLGFGLLAFASATLQPGFAMIANLLNLEAQVQAADMVITGEGKIDAQTSQGKAPAGVAALAKKHGKPVIAFAGIAEPQTEFDTIFTLSEICSNPEESMANAAALLTQRARTFATQFDLRASE